MIRKVSASGLFACCVGVAAAVHLLLLDAPAGAHDRDVSVEAFRCEDVAPESIPQLTSPFDQWFDFLCSTYAQRLSIRTPGRSNFHSSSVFLAPIPPDEVADMIANHDQLIRFVELDSHRITETERQDVDAMFAEQFPQIAPFLLPDWDAWRIRFSNTYNDVLYDFVFFTDGQQLQYALVSMIPSERDSMVIAFPQDSNNSSGGAF